MKLNSAERVTWQGRFRHALHDAPIPPRPAQICLPIWIGTGGTQSSIERAGALGLPLALANISLLPAKLAPMVDLYRRAGLHAGHNAPDLKVSVATHMYIRENSQDALDEFYPYYAAYFFTHTPAQFRAQQITRADYDARASQHGPIFVGSPQQIVDKVVLYEREPRSPALSGSRKSILAACRSPTRRASSSFSRPQLHQSFAADGLIRQSRVTSLRPALNAGWMDRGCAKSGTCRIGGRGIGECLFTALSDITRVANPMAIGGRAEVAQASVEDRF